MRRNIDAACDQHPQGGAPQEAWVRATLCFRKIAGRWLVVHEHASVPMPLDPERP
ncbi:MULTISPECIES: nuclear transport factor 2 family protein [unclassified Cupriavidus]|uniref:nuclear transport factor 2 family protein n=1 Tax=unclassified Cupriavidus TaxID=2640874 RepID=UPI003F902AF1